MITINDVEFQWIWRNIRNRLSNERKMRDSAISKILVSSHFECHHTPHIIDLIMALKVKWKDKIGMGTNRNVFAHFQQTLNRSVGENKLIRDITFKRVWLIACVSCHVHLQEGDIDWKGGGAVERIRSMKQWGQHCFPSGCEIWITERRSTNNDVNDACEGWNWKRWS